MNVLYSRNLHNCLESLMTYNVSFHLMCVCAISECLTFMVWCVVLQVPLEVVTAATLKPKHGVFVKYETRKWA